MALPSSGQLSIGQIYEEVSGSSTASNLTIGLSGLSNGAEGPVNYWNFTPTFSIHIPPYQISDWHSYDQQLEPSDITGFGSTGSQVTLTMGLSSSNTDVRIITLSKGRYVIANTDSKSTSTTAHLMGMQYDGSSFSTSSTISVNTLNTRGPNNRDQGWDILEITNEVFILISNGSGTSDLYGGIYKYSGSSVTTVKDWAQITSETEFASRCVLTYLSQDGNKHYVAMYYNNNNISRSACVILEINLTTSSESITQKAVDEIDTTGAGSGDGSISRIGLSGSTAWFLPVWVYGSVSSGETKYCMYSYNYSTNTLTKQVSNIVIKSTNTRPQTKYGNVEVSGSPSSSYAIVNYKDTGSQSQVFNVFNRTSTSSVSVGGGSQSTITTHLTGGVHLWRDLNFPNSTSQIFACIYDTTSYEVDLYQIDVNLSTKTFNLKDSSRVAVKANTTEQIRPEHAYMPYDHLQGMCIWIENNATDYIKGVTFSYNY